MAEIRCRSRSRFGHCRRPVQHNGPHAVAIGDDFWFGYERGGKPLGYGHFHGDVFEPVPTCGRPAHLLDRLETDR